MIEIWHNPRCSKSRQALGLLTDANVEFRERRFLEDAPTLDDLITLRAALGQPRVISMMRTGEKLFKTLGLSQADNDETLLRAMAEYPILIERPMILDGNRAVIGRPPERVLELF